MKRLLSAVAAAAMLFGLAGVAAAQQPQFGGPQDVDFAKRLWQAMDAARIVGENGLVATTYQGGSGLHSNTLMTLQGMVTVGGVRGMAIVKRNFGAKGDDVTEEQVFDDPGKYLRVYTVMYQREPGYDAEHQDWFYAVYMPNGNVVVNPLGMNMAGRIAAGLPDDVPFGCIACHSLAPGGDYVYLHDGIAVR